MDAIRGKVDGRLRVETKAWAAICNLELKNTGVICDQYYLHYSVVTSASFFVFYLNVRERFTV